MYFLRLDSTWMTELRLSLVPGCPYSAQSTKAHWCPVMIYMCNIAFRYELAYQIETQILQEWLRLFSVCPLCGKADRCYNGIPKRLFLELHNNNITTLSPGQAEEYFVSWKNKQHKQTTNTKIQVSYGCLCISLFWSNEVWVDTQKVGGYDLKWGKKS